MKKYFFLFLLASCTTHNSSQEKLKAIQGFLAWYEEHYHDANSFGLVNQGDGVYYSVNFESTEKYLSYMRSSGFVSDLYLNQLQQHFVQAQKEFEAEPINEGPPPNFDYDIVLFTQEPEYVFEKKNAPVILSESMEGNSALITLDVGMKLQFTLSNHKGKWLIDRIQYSE